jgi:hypothetical protein
MALNNLGAFAFAADVSLFSATPPDRQFFELNSS